ncbi:thioredoxin domain-containing protein 5 homolog [Drosophila pseudoobscura]|uniref:Thioredoxin domain-containing protein 5 homolog n=1 Tax=Drosophila pseudoobscura pseudoobscura TaxID=46245 RepID=A0A6I8VXP1_DROPS|nr:thioredoxin domain-containing protein 5 homolog [Drosophila pseudoobscura]
MAALKDINVDDDVVGDDDDDDPVSEACKHDEVLQLNTNNFNLLTQTGKFFIMIFKPPLSYMADQAKLKWVKLARELNPKGTICISDLDCSKSIEICHHLQIRPSPTFLWYENGRKVRAYDAEPDPELEHFKSFVEKVIASNEISVESSASGVEDTDHRTIDWSTDDFETYLKEKNVIVEFYATLCESCNSLYSILWKLMGIQNTASTSLAIGAINCSKYESFCISNNVTMYPTLLYFEKDDGVAKKSYNLSSFMSEKTTEKSVVIKEDAPQNCAPGQVFTLTDKSFDSSIKSMKSFVKFFQPSCPFCTAMKQVWIDLASELRNVTAVCIAELDCTDFKAICKRYHITAVPKLVWIDSNAFRVYNGGGKPLFIEQQSPLYEDKRKS